MVLSFEVSVITRDGCCRMDKGCWWPVSSEQFSIPEPRLQSQLSMKNSGVGRIDPRLFVNCYRMELSIL